VGWGSTRSAEVAHGDEGARLVWSYTFDRQSPALLHLLWFSPPPGSSGLELRLRSESEADLVAVVEQRGAKFEQSVSLPAAEGRTVTLSWNGFKPQAGSQGVLDPATAEKLSLVDVSAFRGRTGGNRIVIDLIRFIIPSAEDAQR
jgi:hypothetical protein